MTSAPPKSTATQPAAQAPQPPRASRHKLLDALAGVDPRRLYLLSAMAAAPIMSLIVVIFGRMLPYSEGLVGDSSLYGVSLPTLSAAACCLAMGLLAAVLRTRRMIIACCAAMIATPAVYFATATVFDGRVPLDALSLCFLLVPMLAIVLFPRAASHSKSCEGPLVIPQTISKTGNAAYTNFGLMTLFAWVLWFDFCYTLMESVLGNIFVFRMIDQLQAPNTVMKLMGMIIQGMGFVLVPAISIKSDRHRGKRGRRIPYLMWASPFACGLLAVLGFGNEIGAWLHASVFPWASPDTVTIWTFFGLNIAFAVANAFMGTIFYYLFNDVVPPGHFMKFMSYMRVVSTLAAMFYSYFIYQYSNKFGPLSINLGFWSYSTENIWYPKIILVGAAVFYMACGMITFFKMREPAYPPPPPYPKGQGFFSRTSGVFKTIGKECFSHRFYALIFVWMTIEGLTNCFGDIKQPMRRSLGVDLGVLGTLDTWGNGITLVLTILVASYGDRFRPLPLMVITGALTVMTAPIGMLYLIPGLSSDWYLYIMIAYTLTHIPVGIIGGIAGGPLLMELFPRERFGQFSAAGSTLRNTIASVLAAIPVGLFLDLLKRLHGGGDYYYRYAFTWQVLFQVLSLMCIYMMYRHWKLLGGRKNFKPPKVGTES